MLDVDQPGKWSQEGRRVKLRLRRGIAEVAPAISKLLKKSEFRDEVIQLMPMLHPVLTLMSSSQTRSWKLYYLRQKWTRLEGRQV